MLTDRGQKAGNGGVVLIANELVLAENVAANALNNARFGIAFILKLAQAEGEGSELLLHLGEKLARRRALQAVGLKRTTVKSRTLTIDVLDFAATEADAL